MSEPMPTRSALRAVYSARHLFLWAALLTPCAFAAAQDLAAGQPLGCTQPGNGDGASCLQTTQQTTQSAAPQYPDSTSRIPEAVNPGTVQDRPEAPMYRDAAGLPSQDPSLRPTGAAPSHPVALTEFQMLVAGSLGRVLPVYGADLFRNAPATFTPASRIPATPEYIVGPGDQLLVRTWGQLTLNLELTVDRSGSVFIPHVGEVRVAGIRFDQLQGLIKDSIGRVYRNFDINVNLGQLRSIQVFVAGEALRPGSYTLSALSTLVTAVVASGGPAPSGSMRHVLVRRGPTVIADFDLYDFILRGDKSRDVPLESGDVIDFLSVGAQVAVSGSVRRPAIYELRSAETLDNALQLAGGLSSMGDRTSVSVERSTQTPGQPVSRYATEVALDAGGRSTVLQDADLIRVRAVAPRFSQTVTLRGNVASPGRYAWHSGMRIRDLIPDQDALLTPDYWLRREQLGLPVADFQPYFAPRNRPAESPAPAAGELHAQPAQQSSRGLFPALAQEKQPASAASERDGASGAIAASEARRPQDSPSTTPAQRDDAEPSVTLEQPQFPIKTTVLRTAPEINWSYAVIERIDPQTLKPKLIPFNLGGAVLDHQQSENLALESGDVVTVFSVADLKVSRAQQTKYVRLEGEFVHAGIYSVDPGETLHHVIERAGGFTDQAYLYGSQFTRESTRREQQLRLDEYADTLARQVETSASSLSMSLVNAQAASTAGESIASQREIVQRMRSIRATGRVVLPIGFKSRLLADVPDMPLEDGDTFTVPATPTTVGVIGSVYDQNAFLFDGGRLGNYVTKAGGPTRDADWHHAFVIHADGSVVSRTSLSGTVFSGNSFDHQAIHPGDTIVVPQKLSKTTVLRGLADWSSVMSQFALGAAAINVIR